MFAKLSTFVTITLYSFATFAATPSVAITAPSINEPMGAVGVAFFTATSTTDDAITGVMSDCCSALELHRSEKINGIMSMRKISKLMLAKNTAVQVQPSAHGGEHLMLIGLSKPLKVGDSVNVTFSFEKAPSQTIAFPIVAAKKADNGEEHQH